MMLTLFALGDAITIFVWCAPVLLAIQVAALIKTFRHAFANSLEKQERIWWRTASLLISSVTILEFLALYFIFYRLSP